MSASTAVVVVGPLGIRVIARGERRSLAEFISTQGDLEQAAPSVARLLLELGEHETIVVLEVGSIEWATAFRAALTRDGIAVRRSLTVADVAAHDAPASALVYASDKSVAITGAGSSPARVAVPVDWKQFRLDVVDAIVKLFRETAGFDLHHAGVSPNETLAWFASSISSGAKAPSLEASLRVGSWPVSVPVERLRERSQECARQIRESIKTAITSGLQDGASVLVSEPLEAFVGIRAALGLPADRARILSDMDLAQAARSCDEASPAEQPPARMGRTSRVERQRVPTGGTPAGGRTVRALAAAVAVLLVLQAAQAAWLVSMSRSRPATAEDVERLVAERLTQAAAALDSKLEEGRTQSNQQFERLRTDYFNLVQGERKRVDEAIAKSDRELEDWKKRASTVSYDPTVPVDVVRARRFELVDAKGAATAALRPSGSSGELWLAGAGSGASIDAAKAAKVGAPATIPDDLVVKSLKVVDPSGKKTMAMLSGRLQNGGVLSVYESETGNRIAQIGPYSDRRAGIIELWDENGKNIIDIGSTEHGGLVAVHNNGEKMATVAWVRSSGTGAFELYNDDGKRVVNCGGDGDGGYVDVGDNQGNKRTSIAVSRSGDGLARVFNRNDQIVGLLTGDDDGGSFAIYNKLGKARVVASVSNSDNGTVNGYSSFENLLWSLSISTTQKGGVWVYDQWGQNDRSFVSGP